MRLTRIYQPQALSSGQIITLTKEAANHLIRVLRLPLGSEFKLFNGAGGEFTAKIVALEKDSIWVQLGLYEPVNRESPLNITLAQAVLRPNKMDYVIQKTVELGVTRFVPLLTDRSIINLSSDRWHKRWEHWKGIVLSSCEQSGRTAVADLDPPVFFKQGLGQLKADKYIIFSPAITQTIRIFLTQCDRNTQKIVILVGPEGGWSEREMEYAQLHGYVPISLGPRILRAETAGLVSISILQSLLGDL